MVILAVLAALLVYLPIGYAALIEARRERTWADFALRGVPPGFVPGDHRQYKQWT